MCYSLVSLTGQYLKNQKTLNQFYLNRKILYDVQKGDNNLAYLLHGNLYTGTLSYNDIRGTTTYKMLNRKVCYMHGWFKRYKLHYCNAIKIMYLHDARTYLL